MKQTTASNTDEPQKTEDITAVQVLDAVREELAGVRREMYDLGSRVRRYDRLFETAFREEADRRLGMKDSSQCAENVMIGALDRLSYMKR